MAGYRSKSYSDGKMQIEAYHGPPSTNRPPNIMSYTTSSPNYDRPPALRHKLKRGRSTSKSWSFNDPEFQRKRRVASYRVYAVEGKLKRSVGRSFRWIKDKYTRMVYGWW